MKLALETRFNIPTILPKNGDFNELTIKNDILDKIQVTQEEINEFEIISEGDSIKWNPNKAKEKEIEFTELEINQIKEELKKLNDQKKLDDNTFKLYKFFN